MRVGLVGVGTLVEVRRVGLTRVEVEVDRVAQRDICALVERLVVDNVLIPVFSTIGDIAYFLIDTSKQGALSKFINNFIPPKKEEVSKQTKKGFFKILGNSKKN